MTTLSSNAKKSLNGKKKKMKSGNRKAAIGSQTMKKKEGGSTFIVVKGARFCKFISGGRAPIFTV